MTLHHSEALVATEAPDRFAKQLASHLGRKLEVREEGAATRIVFSDGDCLMSCTPGTLRLQATASDPEALATVEDVVGRHLEKFGARQQLQVRWEPGPRD